MERQTQTHTETAGENLQMDAVLIRFKEDLLLLVRLLFLVLFFLLILLRIESLSGYEDECAQVYYKTND